MSPRAQRPAFVLAWARLAAAVGAVALLAGCDNGGLLVVEHTGKPPVQGPSVNELVNGGTYATNGKYKVFYTLGQPTPNQGVGTSTDKRLNGGLVGAAHGN